MDKGKTPMNLSGKNNEAASSSSHQMVTALLTLVLHLKGKFNKVLTDVEYEEGFIRYIHDVDMYKSSLQKLTLVLASIFSEMPLYLPILAWYLEVGGYVPQNLTPICFDSDLSDMFFKFVSNGVTTIHLYFVDGCSIYNKDLGGCFALPVFLTKGDQHLNYDHIRFNYNISLDKETFTVSHNEFQMQPYQHVELLPGLKELEEGGLALSCLDLDLLSQLPDPWSDDQIQRVPKSMSAKIHLIFGGRFSRSRWTGRIEYQRGFEAIVEVSNTAKFTLTDLMRAYARATGELSPDPMFAWYVKRNEEWPDCLISIATNQEITEMWENANESSDKKLHIQIFVQDILRIVGVPRHLQYFLMSAVKIKYLSSYYIDDARKLEYRARYLYLFHEELSWCIAGPIKHYNKKEISRH